MEEWISRDELLDALRDTGANARAEKETIAAYAKGDRAEVCRLLRLHRTALLNHLHESQERLYRLDYVIRRLGAQETSGGKEE